MRTTRTLLVGAVAIVALALWAAPEANAGPFGQSASPVLADVYIGFGYGGHYRPYYRRVYYRPVYYYPRYHYRPYYYYPRYHYRPYYYPRFSVGFGYHHHYPRYRGHYHGHGHRHGHYRGHHHGPRRTVGRRR